jgi:hypothetical protein
VDRRLENGAVTLPATRHGSRFNARDDDDYAKLNWLLELSFEFTTLAFIFRRRYNHAVMVFMNGGSHR